MVRATRSSSTTRTRSPTRGGARREEPRAASMYTPPRPLSTATGPDLSLACRVRPAYSRREHACRRLRQGGIMSRLFRSTALIALLASGLAVPAAGAVAGDHGRHRRHRPRRERRPVPGATVTIRNTATNFERAVTDRRRRPLPRPAAAPRPLPRDGGPGRVRDPRARRHQPRRRPDREPRPAT